MAFHMLFRASRLPLSLFSRMLNLNGTGPGFKPQQRQENCLCYIYMYMVLSPMSMGGFNASDWKIPIYLLNVTENNTCTLFPFLPNTRSANFLTITQFNIPKKVCSHSFKLQNKFTGNNVIEHLVIEMLNLIHVSIRKSRPISFSFSTIN